MLFYGKPAQHALRALSYIANHGNEDGPVGASVIAEAEDIPKPYLSKILKVLVNEGILDSVKGPGGGFAISCDPKTVPLISVVRLFEDIDTALTRCALGWPQCSDENPCALHDTYKLVRGNVCQYLESVTLDAFFRASQDARQSTSQPQSS